MTARFARKVAVIEDPFGLPEAPSGMRFAPPTNTFRYEQDDGIQLDKRAMDLWAVPAVCVAGFTEPLPVQTPQRIDYWTFFLLSLIILLAAIIAIAPFILLYICWR